MLPPWPLVSTKNQDFLVLFTSISLSTSNVRSQFTYYVITLGWGDWGLSRIWKNLRNMCTLPYILCYILYGLLSCVRFYNFFCAILEDRQTDRLTNGQTDSYGVMKSVLFWNHFGSCNLKAGFDLVKSF